MRRGKIYLNDIYAGLLTEDENGFTFAYDAGFLRSGKAESRQSDTATDGQTLSRHRLVPVL